MPPGHNTQLETRLSKKLPAAHGRIDGQEVMPIRSASGHGPHAVLFGAALNVCTGQRVKFAAPAVVKAPAGAATHPSMSGTPELGLYEPAGQGTQLVLATDPGVGLYVPAWHGVQLLALLDPGKGENVPAGHSAQLPWPGLALYEPLLHGRHAPVPLMDVPAGQAPTHAACPAVEYKPEKHWVHAAEPLTALKVPGRHWVHVALAAL